MLKADLRADFSQVINDSHQRSLGWGINKYNFSPEVLPNSTHLEEKLVQNERLLNSAGPFVQLLSEFVAESGLLVMLTDNEGCILKIAGNAALMERTHEAGLIRGAFMSEKSVGTNAIAMALDENSPVQITGEEHFKELFHKWSCSAAPLHNEKGNIIGCLNISGYANNMYPHILGLVVASAKAIEYQLKSFFSDMRLKDAYQFVSQILNTLEFGVLATDIKGEIRRANNLASALLRNTIEKLEKSSMESLFPSWPDLLLRIRKNKPVLDEDVQLSRGRNKATFNVNIYPLKDGDGTISGTVVTLRDMKRVYKMVNKYTGMEARYHFDDLIGESDEMKRVVEYCRNIANSPSTVLIQGESGTGKEVLAQSIHNYSSRKDGGFVALNCGAIPDSLIESELFGYTEGAFTSASKGGKPGKFELADGGTLFLDEIGEMQMDMQVKLLRAIQERTVTRVGGDKPVPVDVRIIAATNKNLLQEVKSGTFRQDLYYRLSVIPVYIPPLRKRREDIPMLINFFLSLKSVKLRKQLPDMDNKLFKKLVYYDWPGNVRELENFIEKYVNLEGNLAWEDEIMNPEVYRDKPEKYEDVLSTGLSKLPAGNNEDYNIQKPLVSLVELEREAIINAIRVLEGNMTRVAATLGISRNALYQKMKRYKIDY